MPRFFVESRYLKDQLLKDKRLDYTLIKNYHHTENRIITIPEISTTVEPRMTFLLTHNDVWFTIDYFRSSHIDPGHIYLSQYVRDKLDKPYNFAAG